MDIHLLQFHIRTFVVQVGFRLKYNGLMMFQANSPWRTLWSTLWPAWGSSASSRCSATSSSSTTSRREKWWVAFLNLDRKYQETLVFAKILKYFYLLLFQIKQKKFDVLDKQVGLEVKHYIFNFCILYFTYSCINIKFTINKYDNNTFTVCCLQMVEKENVLIVNSNDV